MAAISADGVDALHRLKSTDPPLYLSPSPDLTQAARLASQQLFSSLKPFTPKSPFDRLLVDGFDAEQIWQQIDLQTQPLISTLRREVNKLEKNPEQLLKLFGEVKPEKKVSKPKKTIEKIEDEDEDIDLDDFNEDEEDEKESSENEDEEEDRENEDGFGVEDKFLKIKELEEYLQDDEAREYGGSTKKKSVKKRVANKNDNDEEEEEDDDDDDDNEFGLGDDDDEEAMEDARYEDFFGDKKKDVGQRRPYGAKKVDKKADKKRRPKWIQEVNDSDVGHEKDDEMTDTKGKLEPIEESDEDSSDEEPDEMDVDNQKIETFSTHEKNLQKQRSKIEEMEKANMEPKTWTMQGEVTASKRPKDSALAVVLDYQRNVKAAPVITEEVTEVIEDMIQKRISEGHFDDIQRAPSLPSKAPREVKELDENKSKKGLGELYADEYVQKTGLVSAALSFSDEQKKESSLLFKKLCLKLDALSHFHFTPKPVIEDMSIQVNVPALAMEEIAPLAVSDAAMLAPEEVFAGKGDIKEEAELTQAERKRRRANKKRKFKARTAHKMVAKKARESMLPNGDGKEES